MELPKITDVVICKITKITDYGVFVALLEYDNIEGFVHISQVASSWIKNIHNHVKINQIKAAKVLNVDESKNHIDLSFNRVPSSDEQRKLSEYRLFKRAQGLLTIVAGELKITNDEAWEKIAEPILEKEPELYKGFVNILRNGQNAYPSIDSQYRERLFAVLSKNITIKDKIISGVISMSSAEADGVELIIKTLSKARKMHDDVSINYIGPGRYDLKVSAKDYKTASGRFDEITNVISKAIKGSEFKVVKKEE